MTILQLISSQGFYGAESMLLALARTLAEQGHRSIVGVFRDARSTSRELEIRAARLGLEVATMPCSGRWDWKTVRHLRSFVKGHGVDVLHTHGYKADIYGYAAAWPNRTVRVATCHNWPSKLPSMRIYAAIDRLVLRRFDGVATASGPVAKTLGRWRVPTRKLKTIPNGVDMEPFREPAASLRSEFTSGADRLVGFVGRLVPGKGGTLLLSAAQAVLAECPDTRFIFIGEGPARAEWMSMAAQLGISSRVIFAGQRNDMPAVYASLDLVVLPSLDEAMPMCLLEALAASKPVIATKVGAVPRVILPGVTGVLVEPGKVEVLSAAILRLFRDPGLARMLGAQGRSHVARHFASGVVAKSYIDLYQDALRQNAAQGLRQAWQRSRP
ncbi:MAG: glycosyltransferase family 4 protein [Bryobacteraceae bacterium]